MTIDAPMTTARIDRRAISPSRSTGASDQPRATSASSADSSAGASPGFAGAARTVTAAAEGAVSVAVRSERRATIAGVFVAGGTAGVGVDVAEGSGGAVGVAEGAGVSVGTTVGVSVDAGVAVCVLVGWTVGMVVGVAVDGAAAPVSVTSRK